MKIFKTGKLTDWHWFIPHSRKNSGELWFANY